MLQLDATEVAARLDRVRLIDALEQAFRAEFHAPLRQHYALEEGLDGSDLLLTMPAWQAGTGIGVKLLTVFPRNARAGHPTVQAVYVLFDAGDGRPIAMLDGTELTRRRTAAASALAARYLARADARRLLMVGTGSLAPHLIETLAADRAVDEVRVWGRNPGHAQALAQNLRERAFRIEAIADLEAGVRWADIISCATLSSRPLVLGAWLQPGQHLDLVGAYQPSMREADDAALARARIYVDTRAGALAESGELVQAIASGAISVKDVRGDLPDLTRGLVSGRTSEQQITLFKSVGCALEDLAAAQLVMQSR